MSFQLSADSGFKCQPQDGNGVALAKSTDGELTVAVMAGRARIQTETQHLKPGAPTLRILRCNLDDSEVYIYFSGDRIVLTKEKIPLFEAQRLGI